MRAIVLLMLVVSCSAADGGPLHGLRELVVSVSVTRSNNEAAIRSAVSGPFINAGLIIHPPGTRIPKDKPWGTLCASIEAIGSESGLTVGYVVSVDILQFGGTEAGGFGAVTTATRHLYGTVGRDRFAGVDWASSVSELALQIVNDWRIQNQ